MADLYSRICLRLPARPWTAHLPFLFLSSQTPTWKSFSSCGASFPAGFRGAEVLWWEMRGAEERLSTQKDLRRGQILGHVPVRSGPARAVHIWVIFGVFSSKLAVKGKCWCSCPERCQLQGACSSLGGALIKDLDNRSSFCTEFPNFSSPVSIPAPFSVL